MVVGPAHHRLPVIRDRLRPHHPHPRQPAAPPPDRTVAIVFSQVWQFARIDCQRKASNRDRTMAVNDGQSQLTNDRRTNQGGLERSRRFFVAFRRADALSRWVKEHHGHPRSQPLTQPQPRQRPHRHHRRRPTPRRPGPPRPPPRPRTPHPLHQVGPPHPLRPRRHRRLDQAVAYRAGRDLEPLIAAGAAAAIPRVSFWASGGPARWTAVVTGGPAPPGRTPSRPIEGGEARWPEQRSSMIRHVSPGDL